MKQPVKGTSIEEFICWCERYPKEAVIKGLLEQCFLNMDRAKSDILFAALHSNLERSRAENKRFFGLGPSATAFEEWAEHMRRQKVLNREYNRLQKEIDKILQRT